ncbi:MAG: PQQ-dependent sugar dehydrogenase, partial [Nitrospinota bacterium]|nr:PQQ-dependent sugar dehydrogenase [Nitrospinota bacterium]
MEKIIDDLNKPWSLSFIDQESVLITEKPGKLYKLNLKDKKITEVNHNLSVLDHGQGGLLDVLYKNEQVYISYSEDRGNGTSSTSVAKGKFSPNNIKSKNIFRAEPPIHSGYHFGSR